MQAYLDLLEHVLEHGERKTNRTGVDTLYAFSYHYDIDISERFPLLTTKDMSEGVWNSLVHELLWYLSGEEHIRTFREHSSIWDAWSNDEGHLDTAYGRFWRRYPIPDIKDHMPGEAWPLGNLSLMRKYVREERSKTRDREILVFDQIAYLVDLLLNNPDSRRMVLTAWHPANAAASALPPCHYTACFNVHDGSLNCHLTQRSGDIGLGVPFNVASYSALTYVLAKATGLTPGRFAHTIVDAHIYCGKDADDPKNHVPKLREQLEREPFELPTLEVRGEPDPGLELEFINNLTAADLAVRNYQAHPRLRLEVAV